MLRSDMFLELMDWIAGHTSLCGFLGITVGHEVFTDLDFANDVSIMVFLMSRAVGWLRRFD